MYCKLRCQEEVHPKPRFSRSTQRVVLTVDSSKMKNKGHTIDTLSSRQDLVEITTEFDESVYEEDFEKKYLDPDSNGISNNQ